MPMTKPEVKEMLLRNIAIPFQYCNWIEDGYQLDSIRAATDREELRGLVDGLRLKEIRTRSKR